WKRVLPLPYEMASVPRNWFAALEFPVVSYALPALIAIGRARFVKATPSRWNPLFWIRKAVWKKVSLLLSEIQPASGGYLEAAPLTSFVTMALASADEPEHPAAKRGVQFLIDTMRPDGSWPIDTNLATWATTLSIKALGAGVNTSNLASQYYQLDELIVSTLGVNSINSVLPWLLDQQYKETHPFTNSPPGGWAWTDLTGGVPDADDTPGALLALRVLMDEQSHATCRDAAEQAIRWLLDLQNRDGGIPTFCKGWGALPFDRSSPDITAHTLRAMHAWRAEMPDSMQRKIDRATRRGLQFLVHRQGAEGQWVPLWFGNQHLDQTEENPLYGTVMVCRALSDLGKSEWLETGLQWIRDNQNPDGGWGGGKGTPSSIEETALALTALAEATEQTDRGLEWLCHATESGTHFPASPIGFYFAKLWYFERVYPLVWTAEALGIHSTVRKNDATLNQ
ncbi:MAG: prenyltransferase/squalene oxidase repeat-containing protein, partial [Verrucomicrobiota bacterium]